MKIVIDKKSISKSGNEILECNEYINSDIKKLEGIIDSINNAWEGSDSLKFVNSMKDTYIKKLTELYEILNTYGEYLSNVPGAYEVLDETFANKNINV